MEKDFPENEGWVSRPFGRDVIRTKRMSVPFEDLVTNPEQPREGRWESDELKREILDTEGVFEPLLVEPHPIEHGRYLIIDGHRRWTSVKQILEDLDNEKKAAEKKGGFSEEEWLKRRDKFRLLNVEVTHRPLNLTERLRIWVYIHRQRKEWTLHEREMTAYRLVQYMSKASAAAVLGVTVREIDKLYETWEQARELGRVLNDETAAVSWARELVSLHPKYRTPQVTEALRGKIRDRTVVNSKDIRALRQIVPNDAALQRFLEPQSTIEDALALVPGAKDPVRATRIRPVAETRYGDGLVQDITVFASKLAGYSWSELAAVKQDQALLSAIEDADRHLHELRDLIKPQ